MKERTLYYYRNGYNCSQCIIKAAEAVYHIPLGQNVMPMLSGVNTGFGIGGMCSLLVAGIMIFGLLFEKADAKRMRIKLLDTFMSMYGTLNCCELIKMRGSGSACENLVGDIAELVERIIEEG